MEKITTDMLMGDIVEQCKKLEDGIAHLDMTALSRRRQAKRTL